MIRSTDTLADRLRILSVVAAWPLTLLLAHGANSETVRFSGPAMGTRYSVAVEGTSTDAVSLQRDVERRLKQFNAALSTWDPQSDLSRFNVSKTTDWFTVSRDAAEVTAFALRVAEDSGGACDPTIGPLVNLWGFGSRGRRARLPTDQEIARAQTRVGYKLIEARNDPPALKKLRPNVELDLSALAPGYIADRLAEIIHKENPAGAVMVDVGGEVAVRGAREGGQPWRIGVETPSSTGPSVRVVVPLLAGGIATSGSYRNVFRFQGKPYSHTINPRTGSPVEHKLAAVTVMGGSATEADAMDTVLMVLGPRKGLAWAEARGVQAKFTVRVDGDPLRFESFNTKAWHEAGLP